MVHPCQIGGYPLCGGSDYASNRSRVQDWAACILPHSLISHEIRIKDIELDHPDCIPRYSRAGSRLETTLG